MSWYLYKSFCNKPWHHWCFHMHFQEFTALKMVYLLLLYWDQGISSYSDFFASVWALGHFFRISFLFIICLQVASPVHRFCRLLLHLKNSNNPSRTLNFKSAPPCMCCCSFYVKLLLDFIWAESSHSITVKKCWLESESWLMLNKNKHNLALFHFHVMSFVVCSCWCTFLVQMFLHKNVTRFILLLSLMGKIEMFLLLLCISSGRCIIKLFKDVFFRMHIMCCCSCIP